MARDHSSLVSVFYGYQISKRFRFNEMRAGGTSRHFAAVSIYMKESYVHIKAIAVPLTLEFSPFNPDRCLQLYGSISLIRVYRHVEARETESLNGGPRSTTVLYDETDSSMKAVAAASRVGDVAWGKVLLGMRQKGSGPPGTGRAAKALEIEGK